MRGYVIRRVLSGMAVVAGLLVFVFFATHYIGDPVYLLVDSELSTDEDRQALIEQHGFDRPVWEQFADFASGVVRGDLGDSIIQGRPATEVVTERLPGTLLLTGAAIIFTFLVSIPAAVVAARNAGRWPETVITTLSTGMASTASFWLALGLIFVLAVRMPVLPTSGYGSWQNLILPTVALSTPAIGQITQLVQSSLTNELRQAYVVTARSKGLREQVIVTRHVLRNTALVTVTVFGGMLAALLNGTVLIESIFAWPGVGQVGLQAVQSRDLPVLTAAVIYIGVLVTAINLLVDLVYIYLDPRVRLT